MFEPKILEILIETHTEQTGDEKYPIVDICDKLVVNGKKIKIPKGMTVQISKVTKTLH